MNRQNWINKFDYFFVTRPMLFFPGWNTLLAGYLSAKGETDWVTQFSHGDYTLYFWEPIAFLAMLAFALAMGASFILNQLQDTESDRKNRKLFLIDEQSIHPGTALRESIILAIGSILLSIFLGRSIFLLLIFFMFITGYLYNYPPFQFKNKPAGGLVLNALMGWIAFALGWVLVLPMSGNFWLVCLPYLFLNTALYLLTTIPDAPGDLSSGKVTFCVRFGLKSTVWSAFSLYLMSFFLAVINKDQIVLTVNILILFFMLRLIFSSQASHAIQSIKMAIFFFSVIICIKFPLYFLPMVVIFFLTRYYYQHRFQFDYPNFRGE